MKAIELAKTYEPASFEDRIYTDWLEKACFSPNTDSDKDPFVVVIPPPNVTGVLHMGHGLNNSLQDVLVRYHRMKGRPALWVPGTDHAGIATQNVVEKRLRKEGKSRHDLGREAFVKEAWKVKEEHHAVITNQLKKLGCSCDWERERFTLDEGLSKAVREVFVDLYEKNLLYKGLYLVNWCTSCGTALADDEVEHQEKNGGLYEIIYRAADGSQDLIVATTRPETLFGDTAVAVHPEDKRYTDIIGKEVLLPLSGKKIKVIADSYVDREFGTGALKITPGHDPNDWEIGGRHDLEKINILNADGTLNSNVPEKYQGMAAKEARKLVIADLKEQELLVSARDHSHQVGHCYRCNTVIEPFMSKQWFVRMKPLAEKALAAYHNDQIRFYPAKWGNTYTHWLDGIRDWCISRQLWWGHRIPVWYCQDCGEMLVEREDPACCSKCKSTNLKQDEDVLDTWFSSWLWPFSTLGWPDKTKDLDTFYPTSALVTAYDIIFFWVARMVMAGLEFRGEVPFRDIYIHQLVRDIQGRKMSKSLGNGIDPLEIIAEYGADALKFTLSFMAAQGQDILIDKETFKLGSKFANKIWNASRYLLMNLEGRNLLDINTIEKSDLDNWALHQLNACSLSVQKAMEDYRFNDAAHDLYDFFWKDFCDWYIEASKISLFSDDDDEKDRAVSMLIHILKEALKLLHPFLSFITEEIYSFLPGSEGFLMLQAYPEYSQDKEHPQLAASFNQLQEMVRSLRTLRSEFQLNPEQRVPVKLFIQDQAIFEFLQKHRKMVSDFVKSASLDIQDKDFSREGALTAVGNGWEACIFIADIIDIPQELARLEKNKAKMEKLRFSTEKKLSNQKFLANAPDDVVAREKEKLAEFTEKLEKMEKYGQQLQGN